jgi:hypothetical protein
MPSAPSSANATSDVAAPPSAAAPATSAFATSSSAPTCNPSRGSQIQIGYEPSLAYLAQERGGPTTQLQTLLQQTFPPTEYQLVYKSYFRDDLPTSVANGQLDFAILELGPQSALSSGGRLGTTTQPAGVKVVTVPVSYTVMAGQSQADGGILEHVPSWALLSVSLVLTVLASAFLLSIVAYLLNLRPPSPDRWSRSVVTLVDPALSRWTRAWNWMFTTTTGAMITGIWCLAGVCLLFLLTSARAYAANPNAKADAIAKIDASWSPKRDIYEFRSGTWVKCRRTEACLRDYANEELSALLLGDRDTLCWYADQMKLDPPLEFLPDVVVPRIYAIILPEPTSGARGPSSFVATKLEAALARWPLADRPTVSCAVQER